MAEIPFEIDGYITEKIEFPSEGIIYYFIKTEHYDKRGHGAFGEKISELEEKIKGEIRNKVREEMEIIRREKWIKSGKELMDIGLYRAAKEWLETEYIDYLKKERKEKKELHMKGLEYSFLIHDFTDNTSYLIIRNKKRIKIELATAEQVCLMRRVIGPKPENEEEIKIYHQNCLSWAKANMGVFTNLQKNCLIKPQKNDGWITYKNLDKAIEQEKSFKNYEIT